MPPQTSAIRAPESAVSKLPIITFGSSLHPPISVHVSAILTVCLAHSGCAIAHRDYDGLALSPLGLYVACGQGFRAGLKATSVLGSPVLTPRMKPVLPLPAPCKKSEWLHGRKQ